MYHPLYLWDRVLFRIILYRRDGAPKKDGMISAILKCKEDDSRNELLFLVRESRRVAP
jgi:hypothetical protein